LHRTLPSVASFVDVLHDLLTQRDRFFLTVLTGILLFFSNFGLIGFTLETVGCLLPPAFEMLLGGIFGGSSPLPFPPVVKAFRSSKFALDFFGWQHRPPTDRESVPFLLGFCVPRLAIEFSSPSCLFLECMGGQWRLPAVAIFLFAPTFFFGLGPVLLSLDDPPALFEIQNGSEHFPVSL